MLIASIQVARERSEAIAAIAEVPEREALERLFLGISEDVFEPEEPGSKKLHPAMGLVSDDESIAGPDIPNTCRTYAINPALWRDRQITTAMRFLDSRIPEFRPQRSAGNVARQRIFTQTYRTPALNPRHGKTTLHGASKGLPINYYDEGWLRRLSGTEMIRLNAKPALEWDRTGVFR